MKDKEVLDTIINNIDLNFPGFAEHLDEIDKKVKDMEHTISTLERKINLVIYENKQLIRKLKEKV